MNTLTIDEIKNLFKIQEEQSTVLTAENAIQMIEGRKRNPKWDTKAIELFSEYLGTKIGKSKMLFFIREAYTDQDNEAIPAEVLQVWTDEFELLNEKYEFIEMVTESMPKFKRREK